MSYKVIPQVEFDRSVQKMLGCGLARRPAENIALSLWKASIDLKLDFKVLIDRSTASGNLDIEQSVLDYINRTLPGTVSYNKKVAANTAPVANRELRYTKI